MSDNEFEPLKGEPDHLATKAQHYLNIADAIARSVTTLNKIHDVDTMKSQATDKLRDKAEEVAKDINKAHDRYHQTATALITYSSVLRTAQDEADAAIKKIGTKQEQADHASRADATAKQTAESSTADSKDADQTAANKAHDDAVQAGKELGAAHDEWRTARDKKNTAADAAIKSIVEVVDGKKNHGLKDSWWDNWGSKLYDAFKTICKWAGVLAIFLSWVPILGQVLIVLAAIGAVLELVDSIVAVIAGDGSWGDVLMAAGGVVLTFFGGALISHLAKLGKSAVIMKTVPSLVGDSAKLNRMKGILKLKNGDSIAPELVSASKRMRMGFKDLFKEPFKALVPKGIINDASEFTKANFIKMLKEAGPGNPIKNALKINSDTLATWKLVGMNPSVLRDPMTLARVAIPTTVQAVQTGNAVSNIVSDPGGYASDPTNYLGGPTVDAIKSTAGTVHHITGN